ncbi:hypothetical protein ACIGG9_16065 [Pseudonocardia alni]|uniref:hypothetical protein n=1 Tax=Pseudonocardia alni TaxID=33907 RepID=UPI00340B367B
MPRRFATDINMLGFALLNAMLHPVSTDPSGLATSDKGRVWFNTTTNRLKVWNGTAAIDILDRANQSGTQTASTISDLATVVQAYRLDQFVGPTGPLSVNGQRLINVATPTASTDAVTKAYVDAIQDALTNGVVLKGAARVATATNTSISAPGGTIDGVSTGWVAGQSIVLLFGQTTASQNGPWVWNGASSAMTRPANWANGATATPGAFWAVTEGSNSDLFALMTTDGAVTIGTTATAFIIRGNPSSALNSGYGTTVGAGRVDVNPGTGIVVPSTPGSAVAIDTAVVMRKVGGAVPATSSGIYTISGQNVTVNHALNNPAPDVRVVIGSTPPSGGYVAGQVIEVEWSVTDSNNVLVILPTAPASGNYIVGVAG